MIRGNCPELPPQWAIETMSLYALWCRAGHDPGTRGALLLALDTDLVRDETTDCGLMALAGGCRSQRRHCLMFYSHPGEGPVAHGLVASDPPTRGKGAVVSKSAQSLSRNWAPPGRFPRSRGWSKARAVSVPMVASTSMTCAMGAVLPPLPGLEPS